MNRLTAAILFAATVAIPSLAAADLTGQGGTVIELEVNHSTADTYLQYHGRVVISGEGRTSEYRWGGTSCSNKTLPEGQVTMLQRALESGTTVVPRYLWGQGSNRCLVGFAIQAP